MEIKDLRYFKMEVTPEESKKVQKKAFKLGFTWGSSNTRVSYINHPYLFFEEGNITCAGTSSERYFEEHHFKEFSAKEFLETIFKYTSKFKVGDIIVVKKMETGFGGIKKGSICEVIKTGIFNLKVNVLNSPISYFREEEYKNWEIDEECCELLK